MRLVDMEKVYERACAGCTRHGDAPGECYHDEPCERLIFAFTTAEPVEAVVLPCKIGDPVFIIGGKYRAGRFEAWINPGKFRLSDLEKMGKTVFLTRAEAEAALAKMNEGNATTATNKEETK